MEEKDYSIRFYPSDWMRLAGTLLSFVAFGFSLYTLNHTTEKQREMKSIDLMRYFQSRYDELVWEIKPQVKTNEDATIYYDRFWNQQLEQYEYWIQGYIDDDVFNYWMSFRRTSYNAGYNPFSNIPEITLSYKEGWKNSSANLRLSEHKQGFRSFMEAIFRPDKPIDEILKKYKNN